MHYNVPQCALVCPSVSQCSQFPVCPSVHQCASVSLLFPSSVHRCPTFGSLPLITHCTARPGLVLLTHCLLSHCPRLCLRQRLLRQLLRHRQHQRQCHPLHCLFPLTPPPTSSYFSFSSEKQLLMIWKRRDADKIGSSHIFSPATHFPAKLESLVKKGQLSGQINILRLPTSTRIRNSSSSSQKSQSFACWTYKAFPCSYWSSVWVKFQNHFSV